MAISAIAPHTRINNSIIDDLSSQIGIYGLGIYVAIKRHLNTKTGECYPSYQTIARKPELIEELLFDMSRNYKHLSYYLHHCGLRKTAPLPQISTILTRVVAQNNRR